MGEVIEHQVASKLLRKSLHVHNQPPVEGRPYLYVKNQWLAINRPW